jgi:hypothetical protein
VTLVDDSTSGELWDSEFCELVVEGTVTDMAMLNVIDRIVFISRRHCGVSKEFDFVSSHFREMPNPLTALKSLRFLKIDIFQIMFLKSLKINGDSAFSGFMKKEVERSCRSSIFLNISDLII